MFDIHFSFYTGITTLPLSALQHIIATFGTRSESVTSDVSKLAQICLLSTQPVCGSTVPPDYDLSEYRTAYSGLVPN